MNRIVNEPENVRMAAYADMDEEPLDDFDYEMPTEEELEEEFDTTVRMYVGERREER